MLRLTRHRFRRLPVPWLATARAGLLVVALGLTASSGAERPKTPAQNRKELSAAKWKQYEARDALGSAQQDLRQAESEIQNANVRIARARQEAARRLAEKSGVKAAQAACEAARAQLTSARSSTLARLKSQPEYTTAVTEAEAAKRRYERIESDTILTAERRAEAIGSLAAIIRRPVEMQRAAEAGNAEIKAAAEALEKAEARLAVAEADLKRAVETDSAVLQAETDLAAAVRNEKKARAALGQAQQRANAAELNLEREQQQSRSTSPAAKGPDNPRKKKN